MEFPDRLESSWQTMSVLVASAATVAIGSSVSSVALGTAPLLSDVFVLAMLCGLQYGVARGRRAGLLQGALDNSPLVLVADGRVLTGNLDHARVSAGELWSQLRLHGVQRLEQVRAVVLETTGDMSVMTSDGGICEELLGVRVADRLRSHA